MQDGNDLLGLPRKNTPEWIQNNTIVTPSAGFGAYTGLWGMTRPQGDSIRIRAGWVNGTVAASTAFVTINGYTLNLAKLGGPPSPAAAAGTIAVGTGQNFTTTSISLYAGTFTHVLFSDGVTNNAIFATVNTANGTYEKVNGNAELGNAQPYSIDIVIPIK